jgi:hypothetical protein
MTCKASSVSLSKLRYSPTIVAVRLLEPLLPHRRAVRRDEEARERGIERRHVQQRLVHVEQDHRFSTHRPDGEG